MDDEEVQSVMAELRRQRNATREPPAPPYADLRRIEKDAERVAATPEFKQMAEDVRRAFQEQNRNVAYHTHGHSDPFHHVGTCFPACRAGTVSHPHRRDTMVSTLGEGRAPLA